MVEETVKCLICGKDADAPIRADWLDTDKIVPFCDECWKGIGETYAESYDLYTLEEAEDVMSDRRESNRDAYD